MAQRIARIDSYFSLPTDLASEMKDWNSYVSGSEYAVSLRTADETVDIRLVPAQNDDTQHVVVHGTGDGLLFSHALGAAIYALTAHSDNVSVCRWQDTEA